MIGLHGKNRVKNQKTPDRNLFYTNQKAKKQNKKECSYYPPGSIV